MLKVSLQEGFDPSTFRYHQTITSTFVTVNSRMLYQLSYQSTLFPVVELLCINTILLGSHSQKNFRLLQGLNLRGNVPMDFKSITLTTRSNSPI